MNKSEDFREDILTRYIDTGKIDRAPSGFTERVMSRIQMEKSLSVRRTNFIYDHKIPLLSLIVTLVLVIFAVVGSPADTNSPFLRLVKPFTDLTSALPRISFDKFSAFKVNSWWMYLAIGIFILSIFDRALNQFFHHDKK